MKRTPSLFAFAGLELARIFALARILAPFASSGEAGRLFGLAAAPNALFAFGFFFLGLDAARYSAYAPLLLAGKAVSLASAAMLAPAVLSALAEKSPGGLDPWPLMLIAAYDAAAFAFLALRSRRIRAASAASADAFPTSAVPPESNAPAPPSPEPEIVETD